MGGFARFLSAFLIFYWRVSPVLYFIVALGEFLKRGASFTEDTLSWRVRVEVLTKDFLHMHYTTPDLQFGSIFIGFGGHLQGGRNS
jgi:hypothetical protein